MTELYVYYTLRAEQAAAAHAAFEIARGDAPVRLLQRQDASGPALLTWMETYGANVADGATVERRIARALAPFVQGLRQCESFKAI